MTPQAAHSANDSDTVLLAEQIVEYTRPQLFAVWKKLNPDGHESISRKALQRYFIERLCTSCEHACTPVPFAVSSEAPSTASGDQQADTPPSTSTPPVDLPQRLSYSRVVQQSSNDRECEKRLVQLERANKTHACKLEEMERDKKSLNLVVYNIPEEGPGEKARSRSEASNTMALEYYNALAPALECEEKEMTETLQLPLHIERIGKVTADRTKPRSLRLVFPTLVKKHTFLRYAKDLRQAGLRVDDDLTRTQQTERRSLNLDFQSLKDKGYQPYFRGSLLKYYTGNKSHTCDKGKAGRIPAAV